MIQTAILGGGPAGAYCAYCLTEKDVHPVIFDPSHPREKPCGGYISPSAQEMFPFLTKLPVEHSVNEEIQFISPAGKRRSLRFKERKGLGFSRSTLDQCLVNMAVDNGAELIKEKVVALERRRHFWKVKTRNQSYSVQRLIGADGVNSVVRKNTVGPLLTRDKGLCLGYFVKGLERDQILIKFFPHREGYIWVIPRVRETSLGIGCADISNSRGLKRELDVFIAQHFPHVEKIARWTALIPNIKDPATLHIPLAGRNWMLIGDAAGHVNPISGEGIVYALIDGELAAQAIAGNTFQLFDTLWKRAFGWDFLFS